jgi:hypothetical protein
MTTIVVGNLMSGRHLQILDTFYPFFIKQNEHGYNIIIRLVKASMNLHDIIKNAGPCMHLLNYFEV